MIVNVKTPLTYRRPDLQNKPIEVEAGKTLKQFMADIKLPDSCVDYVIINKRKVDMTELLKNGDMVSFIPMMAGG